MVRKRKKISRGAILLVGFVVIASTTGFSILLFSPRFMPPEVNIVENFDSYIAEESIDVASITNGWFVVGTNIDDPVPTKLAIVESSPITGRRNALKIVDNSPNTETGVAAHNDNIIDFNSDAKISFEVIPRQSSGTGQYLIVDLLDLQALQLLYLRLDLGLMELFYLDRFAGVTNGIQLEPDVINTIIINVVFMDMNGDSSDIDYTIKVKNSRTIETGWISANFEGLGNIQRIRFLTPTESSSIECYVDNIGFETVT